MADEGQFTGRDARPAAVRKLRVAILGTGNIGTDLLIKVLRSDWLECRLFAGRNLSSPGMMKADQLGVPVSSKGIQGVRDRCADMELVFDETSAEDPVRCPARYVPSTQRARNELGLEQVIDACDTIK